MSSSSSSAASTAALRHDSIGNQIGYKVRNLAMQGKPTIDIQLKQSQLRHGEYVTSYSTLDRLEGTVLVTAKTDTRFDDIEISFVGNTKTYVDRMGGGFAATGGRSQAAHRFLKMNQPIDETLLPQPRIATAGRTFSFPFTFVIPPRLLPRACGHKTSNPAVNEAHLQLPPSMGDPSLAGFNGMLIDDLAPEMSKVMYSIQVRLLQTVHDEDVTIVEQSKKVRIKPAYDEQPPLSIDSNDADYNMRHEKTLRKGLFKGKLGTLVMEAQQPKALVIPGARTTDNHGPITTMAKVNLRFDPAEKSSKPPRLDSLVTRLKVATHYSTTPRRDFPSKASLALDMSQGYYASTINLSNMCVYSAQWEKQHYQQPDVRRDSGISDCPEPGTPAPSSAYIKGSDYYTSTILVPVALPENKNFLPTFHSCLISRVHSLKLSLSTQALAHTSIFPSLGLQIPIQIAAAPSDDSALAVAAAAEQSWDGFDLAAASTRSLRGDSTAHELFREEQRRGSENAHTTPRDSPPEYHFFTAPLTARTTLAA